MQVQNNLNKYNLYTAQAPKKRQAYAALSSRKKRKTVYAILTLAVVCLFAATVFAINIAFDNTVFAASPNYIMNTPNYTSVNSVFGDFKHEATISITNRGGDELVISAKAVKLSLILNECNIVLDDSCVINHSPDTVVYDGMEVVINSVEYKEVKVESDIPHDIKFIEIQTIPKGTKRILSEGRDGVLENTYLQKYVNGELDSEMLISQAITVEPVTEVSELGVGGSFVGKDGKTYYYSYYVDVQATCYGKADGSGDITYTGTKAREGIIAVDPRVIPLKSQVYVTGDYKDLGVLSAEDTGGAVKGNIIDVYLDGTLQDLLEFGRRNMRAYVLE